MIPALPPTYVDHLVEPRGHGDLPAAQAAGETGSMVGGMGVRVTLAWRCTAGKAVVEAAGALVLGSVAPTAPASLLTERLVGLSAEEAQEIQDGDLMEGLLDGREDTLPFAVRKGAAFVVGALRCALGLPMYRPSDPQGRGILVCRCLDVGDREINEAIQRGASMCEAVGDGCGAGTGCGSCRTDVRALIHQSTRTEAPPPPEHLHPVARIALARVGPVLAAQGLPLRDACVTDGRVVLTLGGPWGDEPITPRGAHLLARATLRETVSEHVEVELNGGSPLT